MKTSVLPLFATLAFTAAVCAIPQQASAGIIGFTGTGGFGAVGGLVNVNCAPCVFSSGASNFDTGLLADGMDISGTVQETFVENAGGFTTAALLQVTNIAATDNNIGGGLISDTIFFVSDSFNPSAAGSAGVGIVGAYANGANPVVGNPISYAQSTASMNYLVSAVNSLAGPIVGFNLTTPTTFVSCLACGSIGFWESTRVNGPINGIVQLEGGINFTLNDGAAVVLPGSLLIDDDDPAAFQAEDPNGDLGLAPEPGSMALLGSGLVALAIFARRKRA